MASNKSTGTVVDGVCDLLRADPASVDLDSVDADATPGFSGKKAEGKEALGGLGAELRELQTRLAADGYTGGSRRVLLVLQGMDTSGKGGVFKQTVRLFNPGGLRIRAFSAPTEEELAHDFLWRVERHLPAAGQIGVFDRSHYEDVLVAKVRELAPPEEIERRYGAINAFEQRLADDGTVIVKCMLHISKEEQRQRLLARLHDPTKVWKFRPDDIDDRALWEDYQRAYEVAIERCSQAAPWFVVPSNRKWYRSLAIAGLLRDTLRGMRLAWPEPAFDVEEERRRLVAEEPGS